MHRVVVVSLAALALVAPLVPAAPAQDDPVHIDPDLDGLGPAPVSVIVQTVGAPTPATLEAMSDLGDVQHVYSIIDAVHLVLAGDRVPELAQVQQVTRIDEDEPLQWHLDTSRPAVRIGPPVWNNGLSGSEATIAVVDTGIDSQHPGMRGRVVRGVVFPGPNAQPIETPQPTDTDGHGTHVAGIVAGNGAGSALLNTNDRKFSGLAIGARLVSLDISQSFTTSTAIRAFEWVHDNHEQYGISVVQNSWGRLEVGQPYDPNDPAVRASNTLVRDDGLVLVFSAANQGPDPSTLSMEAQNPNVLTVGAVDDSGAPAEFSSRGPVLTRDGDTAEWVKPDVAAPGVRIMSAAAGARTDPDPYRGLSGTSQAAPHAAGVVALIRSQVPDMGPLEVMEVVRRTARDLGPVGPDPVTGYGYLDGARALELALQAVNGTLTVPTPERYERTGTLVLGTVDTVDDLLEPLIDGTGAATGVAAGEVPVKAGTDRLLFHFNWTSSTAGPAPALQVTLTTPDGAQLSVPAQNDRARLVQQAPEPGTWAWTARAASATDTGSVDYTMAANVVAPAPIQLAGDFGGTTGTFDDSPWGQVQQTFYEARSEYGDGPVYVILGLAALLGLMLVVRAIRR